MKKATLRTPRYGLVTAAVNGYIYLIGGATAADGEPTALVEAYRPHPTAILPILPRAPLPAPRLYPSGAAVINGQIYVVGGHESVEFPHGLVGSSGIVTTRTLFVYDPAANSWVKKKDLPVASYGGASVAINGKLYVLTTPTKADAVETFLYRYDPATDSWAELPHPPHAHHFGAAAAINGKFYIAGGMGKNLPATTEVYDPATNTWATRVSMPTGRWHAGGAVVDGLLYVSGGLSANGVSGAIEAYAPSAAPERSPRRGFYAGAAARTSGRAAVPRCPPTR